MNPHGASFLAGLTWGAGFTVAWIVLLSPHGVGHDWPMIGPDESIADLRCRRCGQAWAL